MSPLPVPPAEAAADLGAALTRAAEALAAPDLDALLACEAALADAVARAGHLQPTVPVDAARLRLEVDRARDALERCRRLGGSLSAFVGMSLEAQGRTPEYAPPRGRPAAV